MNEKEFNLYTKDVPMVFTDGTEKYKALGKEYIQHKTGFYILAPSGAGKTHHVKNQAEPHWLDGDILWQLCNAHPTGDWWNDSFATINEIDQRCDVITAQAKKLGFWIVGASNFWLTPDAIVIPDWETHKGYIAHREANNYDGGATSDKLDGVLAHREWMLKEYGDKVPFFETVGAAAEHLSKKA